MAQTRHDENIKLTVTLAAGNISRAGFGKVLFLAVDAFAGSYASDRVKEFFSAQEIKDAVTAGDLAHAYFNDLADQVFGQSPAPESLKIGNVDYNAGGGADYAPGSPGDLYKTAYEACKAADPDFYGVCMDLTRDSTSFVNIDHDTLNGAETPSGGDFMVALAGEVENDHRLLILQSANAGALTAGLPGQLATLESAGYERTLIKYHDATFTGDATTKFPKSAPSDNDSRSFVDVGYAARMLTFDPDEGSAPWDINITPGTYTDGTGSQVPGTLTATIGTGARQHCIDNNVNIGLPYGPVDYFVDPGRNIQGRPMYEMVTADWFYSRLAEDIAQMKVTKSKAGEKIPVDAEGQAILRSLLGKRLQQGERLGHFAPGSTSITMHSITQSDLDNQRIRGAVSGQFEVSAREFVFDIELV